MPNGTRNFSRALAIVPLMIPFLLQPLAAQMKFKEPAPARPTQSYWISTTEIADAIPPAEILPSILATRQGPFRSSTKSTPSKSYRTPVNLNMLFPTVSEHQGNKNGSLAPTFAPNYATSSSEINQSDEYFAHHVPLVGGLAVRVLEESKAHPHFTRFLQVIHPVF
jgi:hypothetical protein